MTEEKKYWKNGPPHLEHLDGCCNISAGKSNETDNGSEPHIKLVMDRRLLSRAENDFFTFSVMPIEAFSCNIGKCLQF